MKKFILLTVIFIALFTSCNISDDNTPTFYSEVLPIDSVEMPEQFVHGQTYEIAITYTRPSLCYQFYDFIYEISGHERTIAILNTVHSTNNGTSCAEDPVQVTVSLDFMVTGTETYVFKFYQGENNEGLDQYYIIEVPVVEGRTNITD